MNDKLKALTLLNGVSSQEDSIIEYVYNDFLRYSNDVNVDRIGNVIAKFEGNSSKETIVVFAHTDEIGLIVRKIEQNGLVRFERIGGVSTQILPGTFIKALGDSNEYIGVIGTPSHHFIKQSQKETIPSYYDMYIDFGFTSKDDVIKSGIDVGTMMVFQHEWIENNDIVFSKAIDDRVGILVLLELARKLHKEKPHYDTYLVAASMEEFNIRGILPAIRLIKPTISIGIDITPACDTPDMDYNDIKLGGGPALTYMNFHGRGTLAGVLPDKQLLTVFNKIAKDNGIQIQKEVATGVITENAFILFENEGTSVANVSIPTRYTHTPFESIHMNDVKLAIELIHRFLTLDQADTQYGKKGG
jgi:putative aminopeptidase